MLEQISETDQMIGLNRHAQWDWGMVSEEEFRANENGLLVGEYLMSMYLSEHGVVFCVITEAERTKTTLSLPEEARWI
ncbi:hypothetical protein HUB98_09460 [Paenibacillus barcinonensis]|uniref:Uncharacterized protein n=1 Tax=Paenibacillus barcinonensis TaxID=198119 RepID=A0ABX6Q2X2_PAEBA|nr:hypothetical protein [Paenibacillus barcinonensis]QKS56544.1 hypothetical protein HUB98_09460 [Paenibacillus barcinonensis]